MNVRGERNYNLRLWAGVKQIVGKHGFGAAFHTAGLQFLTVSRLKW